MHYRTIIISDTHLGTPDTKHQKLFEFLQENTCDNLILNGDIIDGRYLSYFPTRPLDQKDLIEYILKISKENNTKVTYIQGNHERFWKNFIPIEINNINFADEIIYESGKRKYLVLHGQQFDSQSFITPLVDLGAFLASIFLYRTNRKINNLMKKIGQKPISFVAKIKRLAKKISLGGTKSFDKKVIKKLSHKKCDGLICGHLHKSENKFIGIYHYLNSGDWIESCTALVETENHEWKIVNKK